MGKTGAWKATEQLLNKLTHLPKTSIFINRLDAKAASFRDCPVHNDTFFEGGWDTLAGIACSDSLDFNYGH
jgi:hypothetical protein